MTSATDLTEDTKQGADLPPAWAGVLVAVGTACGLATYILLESADRLAWQFGPSLGLLLGGLAFCLAVDPRRWLMGTFGALLLALLLALLATTASLRLGSEGRSPNTFASAHFYLIIEALIIAKIALPFLQTWQDEGRLRFPYRRLFAHAWNNGLIAAVSAAFAGLFWIILWLFALLFDFVGFDQLKRLTEEPAFAWPATTAAVALGIFAARDFRRVVVALRRVVFALFSVLTPLFLALSLIFLVALAFGGFSKLTTVVSASSVLVALLVIGIVLLNAVLRDGSEGADAGTLLRRCGTVLAPTLLALSAFAAYAIYLRIDQYGLTPQRVWITVTIGVLSLHSLAYTASLIWRGDWMAISRQSNIAMAALVSLAAVALQTPWGDPFRLSAESQYRRLASGAADPQTFDYGFLRYELGAAGKEVLARIAEDSGAADPEVVNARLEVLAKTNNWWEWRNRRDRSEQLVGEILSDPQRVRRVPADLEIPDDFLPEHYSVQLRDCGPGRERDCLITSVDLTEAPGEEFVLASRHRRFGTIVHLFERSSDNETWHVTHLASEKADTSLWNDLLVGDFTAVPPTHSDLRIGERTLRLRDSTRRP